jgi:hypothetical protein
MCLINISLTTIPFNFVIVLKCKVDGPVFGERKLVGVTIFGAKFNHATKPLRVSAMIE